jgi:hypothetical protein
MYPLYLSKTRSSSPLVLSHISLRLSSELSSLCTCNSIRSCPRLLPSSSLKIIDIRLYPVLLLSPVVSQSTLLPPYGIIPDCAKFPSSVLFPFIICESRRLTKSSDLRCIVIILSNPSASSLLYPLAFVGCWWDLRRDSLFSYLCIILVLGVFQGLCGVWIISAHNKNFDAKNLDLGAKLL